MNFVQPAFLFTAAAIAVPVILHLLFRPRPRTVDLGTTRFLRSVFRQHARRQRIRHWTVLAIRCAALAALAIVFARPLQGRAERESKEGRTIVLLDVSASMWQGDGEATAWRRAISLARQALSEISDTSNVELALFDDEVHGRRSETLSSEGDQKPSYEASDAVTIARRLDELEATGPGYGSTSYRTALEWCRNEARSNRPVRQVILVTDLQQSGLPDEPPENWSTEVPLVILNCGGEPEHRSAALGSVFPPSQFARTGQEIELVVRPSGKATAGGTGKQPLRIELRSGEEAQTFAAEVHSASPAGTKLALPPLSQGVWHGVARPGGTDPGPLDGSQHFAIVVEPQYQVLLVEASSQADSGSESYYLQAAIRLSRDEVGLADGPFRLRVISADAFQPSALESIHIAVLPNASSVAATTLESLREFVERGGGLVLFHSPLAPIGFRPALEFAGLKETTSDAERGSEPDVPARFGSWETSHPVFTAFPNTQDRELRRIVFSRTVRLMPSDDWSVLARLSDGSPAIAERRLGEGRVLVVSSGCGTDSSNWPMLRSYVPFVHQLLRHSVNRADREMIELVPCGYGRPPGLSPRGSKWRLANIDRGELQTAPCSLLEFRARLHLPASVATTIAQVETPNRDSSRSLHRNEIWHWFAIGLLALLMCDTTIANRVRR